MIIPLITFGLGLVIGLGIKGLHTYKQSDHRGAIEIRRRMAAEYQITELQSRVSELHRHIKQLKAEARYLHELLASDNNAP